VSLNPLDIYIYITVILWNSTFRIKNKQNATVGEGKNSIEFYKARRTAGYYYIVVKCQRKDLSGFQNGNRI